MKTRVCRKCGKQRLISRYRRNASMPCGYRKICKLCEAQARAKQKAREDATWDRHVNRIVAMNREEPNGFACV